jgi:hypothetical protein
MTFPAPVPEIPAANIDKAAAADLDGNLIRVFYDFRHDL